MKPDVPDPILARERAELYYLAHPGSPSAVRRPRLFRRSKTWTALLGNNVSEGIAGSGATVELALSAFDREYLGALRPPVFATAIKGILTHKNGPSFSQRISQPVSPALSQM